jgi:hypothetical protein
VSPRLDFHESAELELNEAADFYDIRSPGLGSDFLDEVERGLGHIAEHPEAAALALGNVRRRINRGAVSCSGSSKETRCRSVFA